MKKLASLMLILGLLCPLAAAQEAPAAPEATVEAAVPAPVADAPATDVPATNPPATNVPATNAPATDTPATNVPATDAPATDAPATDVPATNAPATDVPATDVPATNAPATNAPTTDVPATNAPATDAPATDVPATNAPATDVPPTDAPPTDIPPTDVPATATPAPTPEPALEGFLLDGDGAKLEGGPLSQLLNQPGALRVCVSTRRVVKVEAFLLARLREIEFVPDAALVPGSFRVVRSASESLRDEFTPERIETLPDDAVGDLYIWLREELPEATPSPEPSDAPERQLRVTPENLVEGEWSCVQPSFLLEGIGAEDVNCAYAAIVLDERIFVLSEGTYLPQEEGAYSVRFVILDEMGDIASRSEKYALKLDFTAPELSVMPDAERDYAMNLEFSDALSGVDALSLDGGASWVALEGAERYAYAAQRKQRFAAGMILLRDAAGNIAANPEEIVLDKIPRMSGGGGGGGSGKPKKQHASGDGNEAQYAAYDLELPEGPVETLCLGGETLDLSLSLEDANRFAQPASFEARMLRWTREDALAEGDADTLALKAVDAPGDAGAREYVWKINGAVLRKLYNSDVRYLLLEAEGSAISLPTVGFLAGTRYAELKMEGVSTAAFNYEIRLRPGAAGSDAPEYSRAPDCAPGVWVEVAGERFELRSRENTPEMYLCDVYCAPEDLPDYPYGKYPAFAQAGETEDGTNE